MIIEKLESVTIQSPWRTKEQIAEHYGISVRHVTNLQRTRRLPYLKLGRTIRFDINACDQAAKSFEMKSIGNKSTSGQA